MIGGIIDGWENPNSTIISTIRPSLVIFKQSAYPALLKWTTSPWTTLLAHARKAITDGLAGSHSTEPLMMARVRCWLEIVAICDRIVAWYYTGNAIVIPNRMGKALWLVYAIQAGCQPCLNPNVIKIDRHSESNVVALKMRDWPLDASGRSPMRASDRTQVLTYGPAWASVSYPSRSLTT